MTAHEVCTLDDLPDPGTRAFSIGEGDWPLRGFVVRRAADVFAYINSCPHAGHQLNWRPHDFLTNDRTLIMCSSHGALFEIASGECVAGPCAGKALRPLVARVDDGRVLIEVGA